MIMRKAGTVKLTYVDSVDELKKLPSRSPMTEKEYKRALKNAMEVGESVREFYGDDLRGYYESRDAR